MFCLFDVLVLIFVLAQNLTFTILLFYVHLQGQEREPLLGDGGVGKKEAKVYHQSGNTWDRT